MFFWNTRTYRSQQRRWFFWKMSSKILDCSIARPHGRDPRCSLWIFTFGCWFPLSSTTILASQSCPGRGASFPWTFGRFGFTNLSCSIQEKKGCWYLTYFLGPGRRVGSTYSLVGSPIFVASNIPFGTFGCTLVEWSQGKWSRSILIWCFLY